MRSSGQLSCMGTRADSGTELPCTSSSQARRKAALPSAGTTCEAFRTAYFATARGRPTQPCLLDSTVVSNGPKTNESLSPPILAHVIAGVWPSHHRGHASGACATNGQPCAPTWGCHPSRTGWTRPLDQRVQQTERLSITFCSAACPTPAYSSASARWHPSKP